METFDLNQAVKTYGEIMEEIKGRLISFKRASIGDYGWHPLMVEEFCALQTRLVIELIGVGCLVAHGDIPATSRLDNVWSANKIIKALGDIHPEFFLHPVVPTTPAAPNKHKLKSFLDEKKAPDLLDRDGLLRMYGEADNRLHIGGKRKYLARVFPTQLHFPHLDAIYRRLVDLLNAHMIKMFGQNAFYLVQMAVGTPTGPVQVVVMRELDQQPPETAEADHPHGSG